MSATSRNARTTRRANPAAAKAPKVTPDAAVAITVSAVKAWGSIIGRADGALVAVYLATCAGGLTTPEMVTEAAPTLQLTAAKVYSARFNKAAKAAAILGCERARDVIRAAADLPGKKWQNIEAALGSVMKSAKAEGVTKATAAQADRYADEAAEAVSVASHNRKARGTKKRADAKAGPVKLEISAENLPSTCKADAAALTVLLGVVMKYPVDPSRKALHRKACKGLQDAIEALGQLAK
jgi:hypothetical protein